MAECKILKATIKDIPVLNAISWSSKMYWKYPHEWMEKWKDELQVKRSDFILSKIYNITVAEKIIGFCAIQDQSEYYEISHLWILPEFIGKGYGKILLSTILEEIITQSKDIMVTADPNAEGFYHALGFVTCGKIASYPPGRYLPLMKK